MQPIEEQDGMNDDLEAKEDTNEELLAKLWVVLDGMKLAEELVVPTLTWDPQAEEEDEVRALKRAGLLFSAGL